MPTCVRSTSRSSSRLFDVPVPVQTPIHAQSATWTRCTMARLPTHRHASAVPFADLGTGRDTCVPDVEDGPAGDGAPRAMSRSDHEAGSQFGPPQVLCIYPVASGIDERLCRTIRPVREDDRLPGQVGESAAELPAGGNEGANA